MLVPENTLPFARIKVAFINSLTRPSIPVQMIPTRKVFQDIVSEIDVLCKGWTSVFSQNFSVVMGMHSGYFPQERERLSRKGGLWSAPPDREVTVMFTGFIRTIILYLLIIAGIRLMGKRQVGELEPSELVLSLIIADLAAVPMQDFGIPLLTGIVPILTLLSLTMILSVLTMKSVRFRSLMCGNPSVIIRKGKIDQGEMRRNRLTVDELLEELRTQGYTGPEGIEYAILETNGQLSVLPWEREKPPTQKQLDLNAKETGLPLVLISDGRLLTENLTTRGYNQAWLEKQLAQQGLRIPGQVFLMTVDEAGGVYLVPREKPRGGRQSA